jgi:ribosomal protein S27E
MPMDLAGWNARSREVRIAAQARWRELVDRLEHVPCRQCGAAIALSSPKRWRIDHRQLLVRCPDCGNCFWVFAYPLFNRLPASRTLAVVAAVNLLLAGLLLLALR